MRAHDYIPLDMHCHSNYSDGLNSVQTILRRIKKQGLAIALTDHNEIKGNLKAQQDKEAQVLPAIEVNSYDGPHLLVYFYSKDELIEYYNKYVKNFRGKNPNGRINQSLHDLTMYAKEYNSVTSLAHPMNFFWQNVLRYFQKHENKETLLKFIDAIEVINGELLAKSNKKACVWNEELEKAMTAGSDAHTALEYGNAVTYAHADSTEDMLDMIKKKKNYVCGKTIKWNRMLSHTQVAKAHSRYIVHSAKHHYIPALTEQIQGYFK